MDFEIHMTYSEEQEMFRREVICWLEAQAPKTKEERARVLGPSPSGGAEGERGNTPWTRLLGGKGWYAPTVSKEMGGGGLTSEHAVVLNEELTKRDLPAGGAGSNVPAIMIHGTEEQKQRFVVPYYRGELRIWTCLTEPEAGSDLASLKTRAIRDGDEWVLNGSKQFISGAGKPDYLYVLANTSPNAPRHENLSLFLVPGESSGLTIQKMDLIGMQEFGGGQHFVYFDNVRVPALNLIGQEGKGWTIVNTKLELEHGGSGSVGGAAEGGRSGSLLRIIEYLKTGTDPESEPSD